MEQMRSWRCFYPDRGPCICESCLRMVSNAVSHVRKLSAGIVLPSLIEYRFRRPTLFYCSVGVNSSSNSSIPLFVCASSVLSSLIVERRPPDGRPGLLAHSFLNSSLRCSSSAVPFFLPSGLVPWTSPFSAGSVQKPLYGFCTSVSMACLSSFSVLRCSSNVSVISVFI
jgi:hypothetical protein